jgi:hypothetical protein
VRQYSAENVSIAWVPVLEPRASAILGLIAGATGIGDLSGGLARGTFIQPSQRSATFKGIPDGMGNVVHAYNPALDGRLTVLMDAESIEHRILTTLANVDRIVRSVVGVLTVMDSSSRELGIYLKARLVQAADTPKGVNSSVVPWTWMYTDKIVQSFGFNADVVGN